MEKSKVMEIISDETLTYSQQVLALAKLAENEDKTLSRNPLWIKALKEGKVCDLNEGLAPYRPRYILPDYSLLMKNGCEFLELELIFSVVKLVPLSFTKVMFSGR